MFFTIPGRQLREATGRDGGQSSRLRDVDPPPPVETGPDALCLAALVIGILILVRR